MIDDIWFCLKGLLLKVSDLPHAFYSDKFIGNSTNQLSANRSGRIDSNPQS
jgi:hypothetical protein